MTDSQIKTIEGDLVPKEYFRISPDGKITLGKDLVIDEVAEIFFKQLQEKLQLKIKERIG